MANECEMSRVEVSGRETLLTVSENSEGHLQKIYRIFNIATSFLDCTCTKLFEAIEKNSNADANSNDCFFSKDKKSFFGSMRKLS